MSDMPTPQVDAVFAELGEPGQKCPPKWWKFGGCGAVIVAPDEKAQRAFVGELHRFAVRGGFVLRIPHHSVTSKGLLGELDQAVGRGPGGILVLDDLEEWEYLVLERLGKHIVLKKIPVTVLGLTHRQGIAHADALGVPIIYLRDQDTAPSPEKLSDQDLETINLHRRGLGMRPIDLGAGWSVEELRQMADTIRTTGRMGNPVQVLKRSLLQ